MLKYFEIKKAFRYYIKQIHSMLPCVWFSNRSQKTSKCGKNINDTLGYASCATFLFLPHFDVICDLLPNRRTATWNLFVNYFTRLRAMTSLVTWLCSQVRFCSLWRNYFVIEKAVNVVWSKMVWAISDCPGTEQNINIKRGIYNFQKVGVWVQVLSRVALNARKQKFGYW